jgi:hypothetical protein
LRRGFTPGFRSHPGSAVNTDRVHAVPGLADDLAAFLVDREAHDRGLDEAVSGEHRAAVGEVDLPRVISQIRRDAAGFDIELASERPARR